MWGGYAQSHEWNFGDPQWLKGAAKSCDYTANETIDGLSIYVSSDKKIAVDLNKKTVAGVEYKGRIKFGGTGSCSDINKLVRVISFDVEGDCSIYLVFAHGSSSGDDRQLVVSSLVAGKVSEIQQCNVAANVATSATVEYKGGATTIYLYSAKSGINIYDIKVNSTLTTAASSFSTYAASYPVDYTSLGLEAYAITLDEANMKVKYNKIDGVVPANTPVLVKGEASKTYSLTKATTDGTSVATDLQVSDGTITGDGSTIYAFGTKDGVSGFKLVASGVKIPAKKGYLKLSSSATAKDFFAFGGETTGISNISANGIDEEETPLFNLAGQRVDKSYKGVVVKNGKKFVNK